MKDIFKQMGVKEIDFDDRGKVRSMKGSFKVGEFRASNLPKLEKSGISYKPRR